MYIYNVSLVLTEVGDYVKEDEVIAEIETDKVRHLTSRELNNSCICIYIDGHLGAGSWMFV